MAFQAGKGVKELRSDAHHVPEHRAIPGQCGYSLRCREGQGFQDNATTNGSDLAGYLRFFPNKSNVSE